MGASPLLARLGLRTGGAGTAATLAIAVGTSLDTAARIGVFSDTTAAAEKLTVVVGGVTGPSFNRSGTTVLFNPGLTVSQWVKTDASGNLTTVASVPGSAVGLTANFVGFGDTGGTLTGNTNFQYFPDLATGGIILYNNQESANTYSGCMAMAGGLGIGKRLNVAGAVRTFSTTAATSTTTGSLIADGGAGIAGALYVGGVLVPRGGTPATDGNTIIGSGVSVPVTQTVVVGDLAGAAAGTASRDVFVGYNARAAGDTDDAVAIGYNSSVGSGANGATAIGSAASAGHSNGVAIGFQAATTKANQMVLGAAANVTEVYIPATTAATSSTSGTLVVGGGAGFGGNVYAAGTQNNFGLATTVPLTFGMGGGPDAPTAATIRAQGPNPDFVPVCAIFGYAPSSSSNGRSKYGVVGYAMSGGGARSDETIGVYGRVENTSSQADSTASVAVEAYATGTSVVTNNTMYGVRSRAVSTAAATAPNVYGGSFTATGAASSAIAYGVYATASGAVTNWAGYFAGNVNITGTLGVTGKINGGNLKYGTGTPEAAVTGVVGDVFQRTDGGTGTTLYIKESGSGNTGWVPVAASSGTPGGSTTQIQYNDGGAFGGAAGLTYTSASKLVTSTGQITINRGAITGGAGTATTSLLVTGGAHLAIDASVEATDVNFNLARTVQFNTGALANQRAIQINAPTYAFIGASVITDADTVAISGPPNGGTNATITEACGLAVESRALTNVTASYGLSCRASTGATTNYAAQFVGMVTLVGGTVTANATPLSIAQTWNNGSITFIASAINITDTNSDAGSYLALWKTDTGGGLVARMSVTKLGAQYLGSYITLGGYQENRGQAAPSVSGSGNGRIYFDSSANKYKVSENGGAYADLVGSGSGANKELLLNTAGANVGYTSSPTPGTFVSGGTPATGLVVPRIPYLAYSQSADAYASFEICSMPDNYAGSNITVEIEWMMDSVTTGDVTWKAGFAAMGSAADITNKVTAAKQAATTTVPGTAKNRKITTITFTQAQADSIAARDSAVLVVGRDTAAGSPAAGSALLLNVRLRWA